MQGRARAACASARRSASRKDTLERAEALVAAHVDVLVVDTAHGHSQGVLDMVAAHPARSSRTSTSSPATSRPAEATEALIELGVDAVKVGIGAGSICTTRVVAGIGVPMITAVAECARAAAPHDVPVIADGGIRYSGDITKALAVGASAVMIGSLFAGTDESPGEMILYQGRSFKEYRGMGSLGAMRRGSRDRYFQDEFDLDGEPRGGEKLVPEGIEGRVPHKGSVAAMIHQLVGGLRAGMGYCGCADIPTLQRDAQLIRVTPGRPAREPRPRRDHHEGSAELPGGVDIAAASVGRDPALTDSADPTRSIADPRSVSIAAVARSARPRSHRRPHRASAPPTRSRRRRRRDELVEAEVVDLAPVRGDTDRRDSSVERVRRVLLDRA